MQLPTLPVPAHFFCSSKSTDSWHTPALVHRRLAAHEDQRVVQEGTEQAACDVGYPGAPKPVLLILQVSSTLT